MVVMYPCLNDSRVRGADGDFFLHQFKLGQEFALDQLQANLLWHCNGSNTIADLATIFSQSEEDIIDFLQVVNQAGMLVFSKNPQNLQFPLIGQSPYLQEIQLEATGRCNLWCKHCYGREEFAAAARNELTFQEMCSLIDQMHDMNVAKCFLSGGEVFMRQDLPEIIAYLAGKQIGVSGIFTNGTIYRPEVADAIQKLGLRTTFLVSMEGHTTEIHDFMRGDGQLKKTISFIEKVKRTGFKVTVNTVVIKQNVRQLMDMCHFLEDLGIDRWRLSVPREQGEALVNRDLIVPEWAEIYSAYEGLLQYALEGTRNGLRIQLSSIFKTEFLDGKHYYLFDDDSGCCEYKRWSLVLKPNGDLVPCPASDCVVLGNVREDSLEKAWKSDVCQAFKALPISQTDCRDCEIRHYCGGGCRVIAWNLHGSFLAIDDNACPLYRFFKDVACPLMKRYGIEARQLPKPSAFPYDPRIIDSHVNKV